MTAGGLVEAFAIAGSAVRGAGLGVGAGFKGDVGPAIEGGVFCASVPASAGVLESFFKAGHVSPGFFWARRSWRCWLSSASPCWLVSPVCTIS